MCRLPKPSAHLQGNDSEGLLRLHLPALRHASIGAQEWEGTRLTVDRDSFQSASKLTSLMFESQKPLSLTADCFTGLKALASLKIYDGDLVSIPPALTALEDSLTRLELPYNDALQLADEDLMVLLALRKLQIVDLIKSDLEDTENLTVAARQAARVVTAQLQYGPSVWTSQSLQYVAELPVAFLEEHGRRLALRVDVGDMDE